MSRAAPDAPDTLFIGLLSGTSMDGIDAVLVRLGGHACETLATYSHGYPAELKQALYRASRSPQQVSLDDIGRLDVAVGEAFRDAALELLANSGTRAASVRAIGSHGQTLRHQPRGRLPFSLQIGDPNVIATGTGISTVADFRRRDLALGGEGAPLTPAFHQWLFTKPDTGRVVLNIGGIANLTVLPSGGRRVVGFDTGPGNTLLDAWIREQQGRPFDVDGAWAASGSVDAALLERLLGDPYFAEPPPKSTGFEHFNLDWLSQHLTGLRLAPEDVQATLLQLTARTIADAVGLVDDDVEELFVCGGGFRNRALMEALSGCLPARRLRSTAELGVEPDWVEAAAFAWLASRTLAGKPGNLPSVTGARKREVLGCIYPCAD